MAKERTRVDDRKHHYTYLIRDLKNDKVYYGVHSTDNDPWCLSNYHSSSKHLKMIIKEEGITNFTKEVRRFFNSRRAADVWESKVLRRIDAKSHSRFYNKSNGDSNFSAVGMVSVVSIETGDNLRVPVDDPYIGILYNHVGLGKTLSDSARAKLSSIRKGCWSGEKNPIHNNKNDKNFREKLLTNKGDRSNSGRPKEDLKSEDTLKNLSQYSSNISERGKVRQSKPLRLNNPNDRWVYIHKNKIHLSSSEIGEAYYVAREVKRGNIIKLQIPHPKVNIMVCFGKLYTNVKDAAKDLRVHYNTINNRLDNPYANDYYLLEEDEVLKAKERLMERFKSQLETYWCPSIQGEPA